MGAQGLVLTCLGLFCGQSPAEPFHWNQRSVQIPLTFQEARRAEIKQVLLFVSPDEGKTWNLGASVTPDKQFVSFTAPADGPYWLRVASINRAGKQEPDNVRVGPPDQKLIIDTLKPLLRITSAERHGDEVHVAWQLQEDAPDWASFRLEWLVKDSSSLLWTAIPATPGLSGKTSFRPGADVALNIRLGLKDRAGNAGFVTASVAGGGITPVGATVRAGIPEPIIPAATSPAGPPVAGPPVGLPVAASPPAGAAVAPPKGTEAVIPIIPPPKDGPWATAAGSGASGEAFKPVASTSGESPVVTPPLARRPLPPIQYFNRPEVPLDYELSKVGPSGVGSVDLYWTRDDGNTWEKYADDPAVAGLTKTGRFQRLIELPGDGVYGFTLVITSRAGRGKAPPRGGDAPQVRVEIDSLPPVAQLAPPIPDSSRPNSLLLRWQAKDKNLVGNAINLEWSERREGPWQAIALNIENTGQHSWTLPPAIPVQVYLRLRVRDAAGNESVAVTNEPQLVDLSEPEGRLIGISSPAPRP